VLIDLVYRLGGRCEITTRNNDIHSATNLVP
jgi:hypothetical protein